MSEEEDLEGAGYYKENSRTKWIFWAGVGLVFAGLVSSLLDINLLNI